MSKLAHSNTETMEEIEAKFRAEDEKLIKRSCGCRIGECESKEDCVCRLKAEICDGESQ